MNLFIAIHNSFQYIDFCIWEENGEGIETEFIWIATFLVQNKKGNREKLNCSKGSLYPIKISFQWHHLERNGRKELFAQTVFRFFLFRWSISFNIIWIFMYFVFCVFRQLFGIEWIAPIEPFCKNWHQFVRLMDFNLIRQIIR